LAKNSDKKKKPQSLIFTLLNKENLKFEISLRKIIHDDHGECLPERSTTEFQTHIRPLVFCVYKAQY